MEEKNQTIVQKTVKSGITFGSALAMVISYTTWGVGGLGHLPRVAELGVCDLLCAALLTNGNIKLK